MVVSERKVKLVVYSDMVCPWCYIGHKELFDAIKASEHLPLSFEVEYRPYQLDPSLNEDLGVDAHTYLNGRLGPERFAQIKKIVSAKASSLGLDFVWNGKISNTLRAHRLVLKAWQVGGQDVQQRVLLALFKARFEQGKTIGDVEVLSECSEIAGFLSAQEVQDFFDTDECLDEVTKMISDARSRGLTGVPCTVIENKWAVSGGQTADAYLQIFNKLAHCYASRGLCPMSTPKATPKTLPKELVAPEPSLMCHGQKMQATVAAN